MTGRIWWTRFVPIRSSWLIMLCENWRIARDPHGCAVDLQDCHHGEFAVLLEWAGDGLPPGAMP